MIVQELFATLGLIVDDKSFKKAESAMDKLKVMAAKLAPVLGAGMLLKGMNELVDEMRKFADELDDTSVRLGVSVESLQKLRYAADVAGIEADQLSVAFDTLRRRALNATQGSEKFQTMFKAMGVTLRGTNGGTDRLGNPVHERG